MRLHTTLKTLMAMMVLLLASASVAAQYNSGESGQYQILQARYGTARRNVDVTQRLRELAQQGRTFRMGNSTFGVDPDPGTVKTLRIYARGQNGQNRLFEYREGSVVDGSMFADWGTGNWGNSGWNGGWDNENGDGGQYQILQALYGTARHNVDVTQRLRELAQQDTTFRMGNSTFGVDPDPGTVKSLRIYARDRDGQSRMFEYREGSVVDGSLFTGWAGGNWGNGRRNSAWDDGAGRGGESGRLTIIQATYGTGNRQRDVTRRLRSLVRDGRLLLTVSNDLLGGDPVPGRTKTLWVTYTNGRGVQQQVRVNEGERLSIP